MNSLISTDAIRDRIYTVRGQKVMLDRDLAEFYGVRTSHLNYNRKRNQDRFPSDFVLQLTKEEVDFLRLKDLTSRDGHGGLRYLPYAYTEHGAVQLAAVLRSDRASKISVKIVRAFVAMRDQIADQIAQNQLADGNGNPVYDKIRALVRHLLREELIWASCEKESDEIKAQQTPEPKSESRSLFVKFLASENQEQHLRKLRAMRTRKHQTYSMDEHTLYLMKLLLESASGFGVITAAEVKMSKSRLIRFAIAYLCGSDSVDDLRNAVQIIADNIELWSIV